MTNLNFYIFFIIIIVLSIGLEFYQKHNSLNIKSAIKLFSFWVLVTVFFGLCLAFFKDKETSIKFISGYITELSLSVDNIFIFILIFKQYKIKALHTQKLLLIGIIAAIILRIIFIAVGIELVNKFSWILYIFGPILIYTGIKIMNNKEEIKEVKENKMIQFIKKYFRYSNQEHNGKYLLKINQKTHISTLTLVVFILAITDLIFAIDSIPTIISIIKTNPNVPFSSNEVLVIYASNIFAILGLRSLFIILQNMSNQFEYLSKAIGFILVFIGLKMLVVFFNIHINTITSLIVILCCLFIGVLASKLKNRKN